jgi:hypothetical protein
MAVSLAQKLKIKDGVKICTVSAPGDFKQKLEPLPAGVSVSSNAKSCTQIHWFVKNKAEMEKDLDKVLLMLKEDAICWIYYPKGSSKIQTDLTRDKGWDALLAHKELQWLSLISFDETWSAFAMRLKTKTDEKKEAKPVQRAIFDYINPETKEIRLPDDLATELKRHKEEKKYFDGLAFSHRKEYVEWIVSAKREETRMQRVQKTIDMLSNKWKNPSNR